MRAVLAPPDVELDVTRDVTRERDPDTGLTTVGDGVAYGLAADGCDGMQHPGGWD